jgi:hypothetical protein
MAVEDLRATWHERMPCLTETKRPKPLLANVLFALREAPEWQGVLAYDEFAQSTMAMQPPPWCRGSNDWMPSRWGDCDDVRAAEWLQCEGIDVPPSVAASAIDSSARQ